MITTTEYRSTDYYKYKEAARKNIPKGWVEVTEGNVEIGDMTWKPLLNKFTEPAIYSLHGLVATIYCCIRPVTPSLPDIGLIAT